MVVLPFRGPLQDDLRHRTGIAMLQFGSFGLQGVGGRTARAMPGHDVMPARREDFAAVIQTLGLVGNPTLDAITLQRQPVAVPPEDDADHESGGRSDGERNEVHRLDPFRWDAEVLLHRLDRRIP